MGRQVRAALRNWRLPLEAPRIFAIEEGRRCRCKFFRIEQGMGVARANRGIGRGSTGFVARTRQRAPAEAWP